MPQTDGNRRRSVAARRGLLGAAIVILVGTMFVNGELRSLRARQHAHGDLARELREARLAIVAALDSADQQAATAKHLLGWLEQTEEASSAGLIASLSRLRTRHRAPPAIDVIDELAWTGQLAGITDARLRRRLLALQRDLGGAAATGEAEFDRYRVRLEELLSPGMWRHVFRRESQGHTVDYRAQLRELHGSGFDRTLRSLMRGLDEQRNELQRLSTEMRALLADLDGHDAVAGFDGPDTALQ